LLANTFFKWSFSVSNFENFVARHGEFGVQAIIERIERYEGLASARGTSLEDRWNVLMGADRVEAPCLAV
jgi:hypothetical protein